MTTLNRAVFFSDNSLDKAVDDTVSFDVHKLAVDSHIEGISATVQVKEAERGVLYSYHLYLMITHTITRSVKIVKEVKNIIWASDR